MLCTLIGSPRVQADACFKKCKSRKYKFRKIQNANASSMEPRFKKYKFICFIEGFKNGPFSGICDQYPMKKNQEFSARVLLQSYRPLQTFYRSRFSSRRERLQNLQCSEDSLQVSPSSSSVVSLFEMISTEYCRVRIVLVCFSTTNILSHTKLQLRSYGVFSLTQHFLNLQEILLKSDPHDVYTI